MKALAALWNISVAAKNRVSMGSKDLGLLPTLVAVVSSDSGEARVEALKTLMNISIAAENKVSMGSKDLGLLPSLVAAVSSDSGEARVDALGTLRNLSAAAENRAGPSSYSGGSSIVRHQRSSSKGSGGIIEYICCGRE